MEIPTTSSPLWNRNEQQTSFQREILRSSTRYPETCLCASGLCAHRNRMDDIIWLILTRRVDFFKIIIIIIIITNIIITFNI